MQNLLKNEPITNPWIYTYIRTTLNVLLYDLMTIQSTWHLPEIMLYCENCPRYYSVYCYYMYTHRHTLIYTHNFPWPCPGQHMADLEVQGHQCFSDLRNPSLTNTFISASPCGKHTHAALHVHNHMVTTRQKSQTKTEVATNTAQISSYLTTGGPW